MAEEEKEQLTPEELNQTLNFMNYFENYSNAYNSGQMISRLYGNGGYYTPQSINAGIQGINMNPVAPTAEGIQRALANPKSSEEILRNYATYFELNNIFLKRLISFNSTLPAWNLTFDCINLNDEKDFESEQYKKDLKIIDDFCSRTNYKDEFRIILNQIIRQGVYYGVFRDEGTFNCWQELAPDFCKITGNSNAGYLFSFNFDYFTNRSGTNIDMFPKIFRTGLKRVLTDVNKGYNPAGDIDKRKSTFVKWLDLSPKDNCFCFTLNDGLATLVPYYSSLFPDLYLQPLMRDLEKDKALISAQKLLVGILDTFDNAKSGTIANQFKIDPTQVGKFLAKVRETLDKSIGIATLPVKDVEAVDFTVEAQNRYTNYQRNISANAVASSASMLTENKLNAFESELALTIDENFIKSLYGQFENFLNYYINQHTEVFKFKFQLNDVNDKVDRKRRVDNFLGLANLGLIDINLYARMLDMNIFQAQRGLQFTKSLKLENMLTRLNSVYNSTNALPQKTGAPEKPDSVNDSTIASNDRQSNELAKSL